MIVVGADVVSGAWVAVRWDPTGIVVSRHAALAEVVEHNDDASTFAVDIPIVLTDDPPRAADTAAREALGPRRSSVFDALPIQLLDIEDYQEALSLSRELFGRGISKQSFHLRNRIIDARQVASEDDRIIETHPEVAFAAMTGAPMPWAKRTWNGHAARRAALNAAGVDLPEYLEEAGSVPVDDVLDAAAAAWSARRVARGEATVLGDPVHGAIYA